MLHSFQQHSLGRQNQLHAAHGVTSSLAAQSSFELGANAASSHLGQGLLLSQVSGNGGIGGVANAHLGNPKNVSSLTQQQQVQPTGTLASQPNSH
jgi:hypothetical protein